MDFSVYFKNLEKSYWKAVNNAKKVKWLLNDLICYSCKYKLLKQNKAFHDLYKGERVFIVANGPSIKLENLNLLNNEKVFTVNQMIRKPQLAELNPICNFWVDPAYFDEGMPAESKQEFKSLFLKTCNLNDHILNFVPISAYDYLSRHDLLVDRVHFIDTSLVFYDGYNDAIDYSKVAPTFQNIVQFAIAMAIYMGFDHIYLLGVDSTGIITKINSVLQESIEECYSYSLDSSAQKYVNSLLNYFSVEEQFAGWARIFHLYKELNNYCKRRGVELVNCSSQTIIEGIPRQSLERIITNGNSKE